jgi:predicted negative regulator of RcsB-dependent stress response
MDWLVFIAARVMAVAAVVAYQSWQKHKVNRGGGTEL